MYGTEALTPLAAVPLVKVPVIDVEPQFKAPSVAGIADASLMQRTANPSALLLELMLASLLRKPRLRE